MKYFYYVSATSSLGSFTFLGMPTEKWDEIFYLRLSFLIYEPKHKVKLPVKLDKSSSLEPKEQKTIYKQESKHFNSMIDHKWKKAINEKKKHWNIFSHATVKEKLKQKTDPKESASVSSHITQCSVGETGVKKGFFVLLSIKEFLNYAANSSLV